MPAHSDHLSVYVLDSLNTMEMKDLKKWKKNLATNVSVYVETCLYGELSLNSSMFLTCLEVLSFLI